MNLRQRILLIFLGLGVGPILGVGWMAFARTQGALEELVYSQARERGGQVVEGIQELYGGRRAELLYFAENAETVRLLREGPGSYGQNDGNPRDHLRQAWEILGGGFRWLEWRDREGRLLFALGDGSAADPGRAEGWGIARIDPIPEVREEVLDPESDQPLGEVRAGIEPNRVFPDLDPDAGFGRLGEIFVVERESGMVLHHARRDRIGEPLSARLPTFAADHGLPLDPNVPMRLATGDSLTVGAFLEIPRSPWLVLSLASVNEFGAGIARTGRATLALVVLIAVLALVAAGLATRQAMASLDSLTVAADRIAGGDFAPEFPAARSDEVGTLTRAFQAMVEEIKRMLRRVEESRQMAAVGEFASQVAHEIRNPLTAIRVNLQALRRDLADSELAEDHARPLEICIDEVDRLDRVTSGVLTLARTPVAKKEPMSLGDEIRIAVETLEPDLNGGGVEVALHLHLGEDRVLGDRLLLRGVILNLLRNAAEAMPEGGRVEVSSELLKSPRRIRVHVTDQGPGIPSEIQADAFLPFVTTKAEGVGLGLAMAAGTIEAHGGQLRVAEDEEDQGTGAHFILDLPLMEGDAA